MRVLFTTWAWPSHYFPMVPLAWALRAAGHEVRMTSQPDLLPTMLASGLPATAVGTDIDMAAIHRAASETVKAGRRTPPVNADGAAPTPRRKSDRVSDQLTKGEEDPRALHRLRAFLALRDMEVDAQALFRTISAGRKMAREEHISIYGEVANAMVDDLLHVAESWGADAIVYDPLTYAGPLVAKALGIPAIRHMFGPDVSYFSAIHEGRTLGPITKRLGIEGPVALNGDATVDPTPPSLQFPHSVVPTRRIHTRYVPYNGLSEIPVWIHDKPAKPRIALTWGSSMVQLLGESAFLPEEILNGATKLAEERGAELVLAIASSQRNLLPPLADSVKVVEGVPLLALLASCDAIIHQGGAGTMLTALTYGLPQLVFSQMPDQAANALNLVTAGAGQTRPVDEADATAVLQAGHEILDDPSFAAAGERLKHEMLDQPTPAEIGPRLAALAG
jgi:UDP:flavonoid glycosyltransferase YjiC (YdhE family)